MCGYACGQAAERDPSQAAMSVCEAGRVSRGKGRARSAVTRESKASDGNRRGGAATVVVSR